MTDPLTHQHFHRAILNRPADWLPRLIYADWLEEQGDPRGELIRLLHELLQRDCDQSGAKVTRLQELALSGLDLSEITPTIVVPSIGLEMTVIPPGGALLGARAGEVRERDFQDARWVDVPKPYYLGVYAVTQQEFETVMGFNPSHYAPTREGQPGFTDWLPVEQVTWFDKAEFCNRLSKREGFQPVYQLSDVRQENGGTISSALVSIDPRADGFCLPTESEWEFACRCGTSTPYFFGRELTHDLANFAGGPGRTVAVGTYPPNAFGLYEMHGNVWERVEDRYDGATNEDGGIPTRVSRGGGWFNTASYCCSAGRSSSTPGSGSSYLGFRLARRLPE